MCCPARTKDATTSQRVRLELSGNTAGPMNIRHAYLEWKISVKQTFSHHKRSLPRRSSADRIDGMNGIEKMRKSGFHVITVIAWTRQQPRQAGMRNCGKSTAASTTLCGVMPA